MNLNVFAWIREGIRQSVLLGVTDALDDIGGVAPDGDDLKGRLQQNLTRRNEALLETQSAGAPNKPKRLGRSLKDLDLPGDR